MFSFVGLRGGFCGDSDSKIKVSDEVVEKILRDVKEKHQSESPKAVSCVASQDSVPNWLKAVIMIGVVVGIIVMLTPKKPTYQASPHAPERLWADGKCDVTYSAYEKDSGAYAEIFAMNGQQKVYVQMHGVTFEGEWIGKGKVAAAYDGEVYYLNVSER